MCFSFVPIGTIETSFCSSTPLFSVARNFSDGKLKPYEQRTVFEVNQKFTNIAADVAWVSPFPEQEVIIKIRSGVPIYKLNQELLDCNCKKLDCHHTRQSLKIVTIVDAPYAKLYFQKKVKMIQDTFVKTLSHINNKLDKGLFSRFLVSLIFSHYFFVFCV